MTEPKWPLRTFLLVCLMADGTPPFMAQEALASTALAHPEWDLTEERTFEEWLAKEGAVTREQHR